MLLKSTWKNEGDKFATHIFFGIRFQKTREEIFVSIFKSEIDGMWGEISQNTSNIPSPECQETLLLIYTEEAIPRVFISNLKMSWVIINI